MGLQVRRVVTGHDGEGKAVVKIDDLSETFETRANATATNVWSTEGFPVDNTGEEDAGKWRAGTSYPNGTVFRIIEFRPGVAPRVHRTDSIDYAVVLSGEIEMELDDSVVQLRAGDALVQRGTVHSWNNPGPDPCVMAFILVDAKPVEVNGEVLNAFG